MRHFDNADRTKQLLAILPYALRRLVGFDVKVT